MNTKTKKVKNKKSSPTPGKAIHSPQRKTTIENRDLNEDEQQQITNAEHQEQYDEARVEDSNLNPDNRGDNKNTGSVEEEEDREQIRKEDEAQGNEQV